MKLYGPGVGFQPFYDEGAGGAGAGAEGDGKDVAYWQAEAQKAFKDRDAAKKRAKELESKVFSDEDIAEFQRLRTEQEKAEEIKKRKEGEFDSLKTQLTERHKLELAERETRINSLSTRFQETLKRAAFGSASDLFGGHDKAKTILDVDLAMSYLGKFVTVEDDDSPEGSRIVVKNPKGETILGEDGNPAPFHLAMEELISKLPNKDRILRGSGKTGSGSSGGSAQAASPADVTELTKRATAGDKDAIAALKRRRASSGALVMGSALTR